MADEKGPTHDLPNRTEPRGVQSSLNDLIQDDQALSRPVAGRLRSRDTGMGSAEDESWDLEEGTDVLCVQGHKVGEVVGVTDDHLVVECGFFIPHDIYVPKSIITSHDETGLHLNMSKEQIEKEGWAEAPAPGDDEHPQNPSGD